ncbi:hypothetical protein [Christiangramia aquimixticola]|uniref:hypothetical protein n=1 Tax=Christiangramia aquimixticola TaxID=1697558 RepID=UPI003AA82B79
MAPIKFEEHIKEKLAKREIKPSAAGWEKLNEQLEVQNKNRSNKKWWYSSVAAVAVLIIYGVLFVDLNSSKEIQIVDTPSEEIEVEKDELIQQESVVKKRPEEFLTESTPNESSSKARTSPLIKKDTRKQISHLASEDVKPQNKVILDTLNDFKKTILLQEVETLLANASKKEEVTEAEINALLANAAKEISRNANGIETGKISPSGLLAEVEYEVDQSFRKEVFDFLKAEFLKAKTAVATRNE